MSALTQALISGQVENSKPLNLLVASNQAVDLIDSAKKSELKKEMQNIQNLVNTAYSYKAVEFPSECNLIKLSSKHNLLIGANSTKGSIDIVNLSDQSKNIEVEIANILISCIRMNKNQDKIYLGDYNGNIFVYDFPSLNPESVKKINLGLDKVIFDVFDDKIYAASFSSNTVLVIDNNLQDYKIIGYSFLTNYVRVSNDGKYVAVSDYSNVFVYSRELMCVQMAYEVKFFENGEEVGASELKKCEIEFFKTMQKICISHDNLIDIWNLDDGNLECTKKLDSNSDITSLKLSDDDRYLIAVGYDHSINIWDLYSYIESQIFINHPIKDLDKDPRVNYEKVYYDLEIDEDRNLIYTHSLGSKYSFQWKGVFLDKAMFPNSTFGKAGQCCVTCKPKNEIIVTVLKEGKFLVWDIETLNFVKEVKIPKGELLSLTFAETIESNLLIGSENIIYEYQINDYSYIRDIRNDSVGLIYCIKANSQYIVSGGSNKSIVVQNTQGLIIKEITFHNSEITAMKLSTNYIITGDTEGVIGIHVLNTWALHASLGLKGSPIKSIELLKNNDTIITIGEDGKCIFWSIYDKIDIKTLELKEYELCVNDCYLSNDERRFYLSEKNGFLLIYNLPSFKNLATLPYYNSNQRFTMDSSEKYLLVSNDSGLFRTKGAVSVDHPLILDENINVPKVRRFLNGGRRGDLSNQNSWVIAPYMVNSLHYYADENDKINLKAAMLKGAYYIKSSLGTPLDIALAKGNTEAAGAIISKLKERVNENKYALETLSDCLCELNNRGYKGLDELYNECLIKSPESLPETCAQSINLPIIHYELTMKVDPTKYIGSEKVDKGKRITFLISTIRMNVEIGSQESLDFLESLLNCSNTEIFKTQFIQTILYEKWKNVRIIMYLNSLLFVFYLISLSLFIITRDPLYLIIALVWNILTFIYEVIQMGINFIKYWKDFWNYIDMSRAGLFYVYFCLEITKPSTTSIKSENTQTEIFDTQDIYTWILVLVTILSWIRGITLFSLSSSTRYMVSLLGEVLKDIISFAVVVFYSILSFALIKMAFPTSEFVDKPLPTIGTSIIDAYFEAIGGGDGESTGLTCFLVIVNSVFNVIIMMNLLISILGTTYSRVNDNAEVEDLKELTEMIIEAERFYINKRGEKRKTIMQICEEYTPPETFGHDTIGIKLKSMRGEVESIQSAHEEVYNTCINNFEELIQLHANTQAKIENNIKDIVKEIKKNQDEMRKELIQTINNQITDALVTDGDAFLCPNDHILNYSNNENINCIFCNKLPTSKKIPFCKICYFAFCQDCEVCLKLKSEVRTSLKCNENHVFYYYPNLNEYLEYLKMETNQTCRFCNEVIKQEAHGCVLCRYFACINCINSFKTSENNKDESLKCLNSHILTWKQRELYKENFKIKCSDCNNIRIGAGFFICSDCSYYLCLSCVSKCIAENNKLTNNLNQDDAEGPANEGNTIKKDVESKVESHPPES
ncbi:hypothetical protein SteCoe_13994 [Stentor coeruleus]|uniref:Uncharacterized protein n=1 Tax=Stentor coeruleus TaxID=5963 RepID=A0A1R2C724_9CILI|nr:hypothetical protein SteCoe_13994 [Stentor coeruleus]